MPVENRKNTLSTLLNLAHYTKPDWEKITIEIIHPLVHYYENIVGCMPGNVFWLDKYCRTVGCNKNVLDMFGLRSQDEFVGLDFDDMAKMGNWSQKARDQFKSATLDVIQTGLPKLNLEEPPIPHSDGRIIYFLTNRVPLTDASGQIIGMVGISFDITNRKNAELKLKRALAQVEALSQAKSEFIANITHDVKTPLSGMIGLAETLIQGLTQPDDILKASMIQHAGQQLMHLFDSCIAVSNIEMMNQGLPRNRFSLYKMLAQISQLFAPNIKMKQLEFSITYDASVPEFLLGHREGVSRIMLNLIGNAIKFTNQGNIMLHVSLEKVVTDAKVVLKFLIQDTGIGIPKEKQKIVFDRFTRIIPSSKSAYEGSGIGLYVVNQLVKAMGGQVDIHSRKEKGSTFSVVLPFDIPLPDDILDNKTEALSDTENLYALTAAAIQPFYTAPVVKMDNEALGVGKYRVLLVEDNHIAQKIVVVLLSSMDCYVEIAHSGKLALTLFEPKKYDLILLDIGLPDFSGPTVAELVRIIENQHGGHHTPMVALSAYVDESTQNECLAAGINEVLEKPFSLEKGREIVARYIKNTKVC